MGASAFLCICFIGLLINARLIESQEKKHSGHPQGSILDDTSLSLTIDVPLSVNCSMPVCSGPLRDIYCIGPLLTAAWQLGLQNSCPGAKIKGTAQSVLDDFKKLTYPLEKRALSDFCSAHFESVKYLERASFTDWTAKPEAISKIPDEERRTLAFEINRRWNELGRRFSDDVIAHPELFPVTPVPEAFIVPGGEFDIYFYWDSYWVIEGLLVSNMSSTARGILSNFAKLIETHGFIPNSGRIQHETRSQPPLFTQMLSEYFLSTGDANFTRTALASAEKELSFWEKQRRFTVAKDGANYDVFQYKAQSNCPRPENFLVDYEEGLNNSRTAEDVWSSITSACESGWDFSSRWFDHNGTNAFKKRSIHTNSIVPVDLNSFMAWNYRAVASLYKKLNDTAKSSAYRDKFNEFSVTLDKFFWNEQEGIWLDYDIETSSPRRSFYPSNLFPLLSLKSNAEIIKRVAEYLGNNKIFTYPGGVPSTLPVNSSEQWDFPNVWAPTLHLFVMSLLSTRDAYLVQKAKETADKFIHNVYQGLYSPPPGMPKGIWEKYDATKADGSRGGGGEYLVQEGFAWTNGAVMHLIMMFDQPAQFGYERKIIALDSDGAETIESQDWMLGGFPHNIILGGLILLCLALSVLFIVVADRNLRRRCDYRRDRSERDHLFHLLRDIESDEDP